MNRIFEIGAITHPGHCKEKNEDHLLIKIGETEKSEFGIFAIADGVSSLSGTTLASQEIIAFLDEYWQTKMPFFIKNDIQCAMILENLAKGIVDKNTLMVEAKEQKGTTLSLLFIKEQQIGIVHIGDSRIYRYGGALLEQLTTDHTYVAKLISCGKISKEEAKQHPQRHIITQCIGASPHIDLEVMHGTSLKNSIFLICSDGCYDCLDEKILFQTLYKVYNNKLSPQKAVEVLLKEILKTEAKDNISIIIVGQRDRPLVPKRSKKTSKNLLLM
jgi:protein phosphatase